MSSSSLRMTWGEWSVKQNEGHCFIANPIRPNYPAFTLSVYAVPCTRWTSTWTSSWRTSASQIRTNTRTCCPWRTASSGDQWWVQLRGIHLMILCCCCYNINVSHLFRRCDTSNYRARRSTHNSCRMQPARSRSLATDKQLLRIKGI